WCLRNYLILTECPELLGEPRLSEAVRYWSRYYWLFRFARVWSAVVGYDAGLEQQVFQLLEYPPEGLGALPEVEAAAQRAAAARIGGAGRGWGGGAEPFFAPACGGRRAFQSSTSPQPPQQVNGVVRGLPATGSVRAPPPRRAGVRC